MKKLLYLASCFLLLELFTGACNREIIQLDKLQKLRWQSEYEPNNSWTFESDSCYEYYENFVTFAAKYQVLTPDTAKKPYIIYYFGGSAQHLRIDTITNRKLVLFHIESLNALKFIAKSKNQRMR